MESIYLDHAATSPLHNQVIEAMWPIFTEVYGNPSSVHSFGREARKYLDSARRTIAKSIHAHEKEITFTSGGTEANNLALIGTAFANQNKGKHIITTEQEHHATLNAVEYLEKEGFKITYLPIYKNGQIKSEDLMNALTEETIIVSIIYVNNETGIIQPIEKIGHILKEHQAYFHTDAVQAYELFDINVKELNIDLLTVSSHKINGPKGTGFLYAANGIAMKPMHYGGEQERKRRPGTENVANIVGFQTAVQIVHNNRDKMWDMYDMLKQQFIESLKEHQINFKLNGDQNLAIPSIINISFPGTNVESLLTNFDIEQLAASSGSACTAGSVEPSHVLSAMFNEEKERSTNSIRFSFGINNSEDNIKEAVKRIAKIIQRLTNVNI